MSATPFIDLLTMRQLLLANTASQPESDLRKVVTWLSRFGFTADEISSKLGLPKGDISVQLTHVGNLIASRQLDVTLYQGNGRFGKLFLVFAELLKEQTIKGAEINAPVRAILLRVLGVELDITGLTGFMSGWHAGRGRPVSASFNHLQIYLELLLEHDGYPSSTVPTTAEDFLRLWSRFREGRARFLSQSSTRVFGRDNDPDEIDHARLSISNGVPGATQPSPTS